MMRTCLAAIALSGVLTLTAAASTGGRFILSRHLSMSSYMLNLIASFSLSTGTISLTSSDPDASSATASWTANWSTAIGVLSDTWTLGVAASSASLTNCPAVSLNALRLSCSSINVSGISLGGTTSACSSPITLSTNSQTIASGTDGAVLTVLGSHVINLKLTFLDSWKYPATSTACTLSLNYALNVF